MAMQIQLTDIVERDWEKKLKAYTNSSPSYKHTK